MIETKIISHYFLDSKEVLFEDIVRKASSYGYAGLNPTYLSDLKRFLALYGHTVWCEERLVANIYEREEKRCI